jgi:hypothetical protein
MGVLLGANHAASMIDTVDHIPFAFVTYGHRQQVAPRRRWVPDWPAHFVQGKDWSPGRPPRLPIVDRHG